MKVKQFKLSILSCLVILTGMTISVNGQDKRLDIANKFVRAVFITNEDPKAIMSNYMYFEPVKDYPMDKRLSILKSHIKKILSEKASLIDSNNYVVIPYDSYKAEKVNFPKQTEDIFVLERKDKKPVLYLFFKNNKVFAFDYILKGSEAYFITY